LFFLSRNWERDKHTIEGSFAALKRSELPFWLFTHPEGYRISPEKKSQAHEFAKQNGLPILNHVLLPRVKGFAATVTALETSLDAVYDVTVVYGKPPSGILGMCSGDWFIGSRKFVPIDIYLRRYPLSTIPKDEEKIKEWLYTVYKEKDDIIAYWKDNHKFPDHIVPIPQPPERKVTWPYILNCYLKWVVYALAPSFLILTICLKIYWSLS